MLFSCLSFTLNIHGCLPFFPSGVSSNLLIPFGSNVCKPLSMYFLLHYLLCLFLCAIIPSCGTFFSCFVLRFFPEIQSGDLKKQKTLEVSSVITNCLHVLWCSRFYIENIYSKKKTMCYDNVPNIFICAQRVQVTHSTDRTLCDEAKNIVRYFTGSNTSGQDEHSGLHIV